VISNKISYFDRNPKIEELRKYTTDSKIKGSCSIVQCQGNKLTEETGEIVERIVKFVEKYTGIYF
jgi:hypothetical protein